MHVAVLGLGEAGGRIAADLVTAGCIVRGWDPVRRPEGVETAVGAREAVNGADVVLSVNAAAVALDVAAGVADALAGDGLYADLAAVIGEPLLERLLSGTQAHAARRVDEMNAAAAYLEELGVSPRIASAAADVIEQLRDAG